RKAADDLGRENAARQQALEESERRRQEVVRFSGLSARLTVLEGQRQCEAGRGPQGVLSPGRAPRTDPRDHRGLHEAIRTNLDAWSGQLHPLRDVLADEPHADYGGGQDKAQGLKEWWWEMDEVPAGRAPFTLPTQATFSPDGKRALGFGSGRL